MREATCKGCATHAIQSRQSRTKISMRREPLKIVTVEYGDKPVSAPCAIAGSCQFGQADNGKSWYMHTIEGKPAYYSEHNQQICYICRRVNERGVVLVSSLRKIRQQQAATRKQRAAWGCVDSDDRYDYVVFAR